eukprot:7123858-Pyramimonas_sp.AAC.1
MPPVTIHTDSECVFSGVVKRGREACCALLAAHADVWELLWTKLEDWGGVGPASVRFVKVKAHPTPEQRRSIDPRLLAGNGFADQWAKKVAALGRLDFERRDRCRKFSRLVRAVGEQ